MSNKKLTGTLIPKDNKKAKMHATFYSDKPVGSDSDSEIFNEHIDATDQQRNTALANVSNQTANSITGKMGYKVLDPTKTFASQVTSENTIYEIRDVFDLENGSVTIPNDCTLNFNGGTLKNGTILFDDTILSKDSKFNNIIIQQGSTFKGDVYAKCFDNLVNNTSNLNYFLNSNADNIFLENRTYNVIGTFPITDSKYNMTGWTFCLLLKNVSSKIHFNNCIFKQEKEDDSDCPVLGIFNTNNFEISNLTVIGEKLEHTSNTGQWNHGILIGIDCSNIDIHDCTIKENYGDNICLANNSNNEETQSEYYAKNITIRNCTFGNAIRNNISIISGKNIVITNNSFLRIDNSKDSSGDPIVTDCNSRVFIDMEENYSWETTENIVVANNYMYSNESDILSCTGGISVHGTNDAHSIHIVNNYIENCWYYGISAASRLAESDIKIIGNTIVNVAQNGAFWCSKNCGVEINNNNVFNSNIGYFGSESNVTISNCNFNNYVGDYSSAYSTTSYITLNNCSFFNYRNVAFANTTINNCSFDKVSRIRLNNTNSLVNCRFSNSIDNLTRLIECNGSSTTIDKCLFENINLQASNGVIHYSSGTGTLNLKNSSFINCSSCTVYLGTIASGATPTANVYNIEVNSITNNNGKLIYASSGWTTNVSNSKFDIGSIITDVGTFFGLPKSTSTIVRTSFTILETYYIRLLADIANNFDSRNFIVINNNIVIGHLNGATGSRPINIGVGTMYFDTSLTPSRYIVWNGTAWTNLDGTSLS